MAERSQKEYIKDMKGAKKAAYIWYYYKWFFIIFGGIAVVLILVGRFVYRTPTDYMAEVVLVNASSQSVEETDYFDEFITAFDYEEGYDHLYVDASLTIDTEDADSTSSSAYQILAAKFLTGEIDVFVSNEEIFAMMAENSGFLDLTVVLTDDMLEKYADKLYYYVDENTGESLACGVYLDESELYTGETIYGEIPIAGIGSQTVNESISEDVILYFLGEGD